MSKRRGNNHRDVWDRTTARVWDVWDVATPEVWDVWDLTDSEVWDRAGDPAGTDLAAA
jgi:hypothetical protein